MSTIHRIADSPPQFPCWIFHKEVGWKSFRAEGHSSDDWGKYGWTHWHPDQPEPPQMRPAASEMPAWAQEAAAEIAGALRDGMRNIWKDLSVAKHPAWEGALKSDYDTHSKEFAAIIAKHAPPPNRPDDSGHGLPESCKVIGSSAKPAQQASHIKDCTERPTWKAIALKARGYDSSAPTSSSSKETKP